ncbi:unnamed protein product [Closterium sp. Yama58-4]|nr:unnamed protein product [Closterium sp. Yama58-4]
MIFPLRSKGEVPDVLIPWICASFTLPASPQQNGVTERRIGLVMKVAHTSMMHAVAPHFLWPFVVWYAAHYLNLWPRVSLPETSPTLRWTGKVGDASVFRVWGARAFVRDTSADKLSSRAIPCVFLGFPPDAPGWQFYQTTLSRVLSSQDVTFDKSVPFYRLFPYRTAPPPPLPATLPLSRSPSGRPPPPSGSCSFSLGVLSLEPSAEPVGAELAGAELAGAEPGGVEHAEPRGAEPERAEPGGTEPKRGLGVLSLVVLVVLALLVPEVLVLEVIIPHHSSYASGTLGAAVFGVALLELEALRLETLELEVPEELELLVQEVLTLEVLELPELVVLRALELEPLELVTRELEVLELEALERWRLVVLLLEPEVPVLRPRGTRPGGTGAGEAGGAADTGAGGPGAGSAEAGGTGAGGAGAGGAGAGGTRAGDPGAGGAGVAGGPGAAGTSTSGTGARGAGAGGTAQPRCFFAPPSPPTLPPPDSMLRQVLSLPSSTGLPLQPGSPLPAPSPYTEQTDSLTERREPASRPASPVRAVRTGRRVPRQRPPPVPGTHTMTLRPSSVPQRVPLPSPPTPSLPHVPDHYCHRPFV